MSGLRVLIAGAGIAGPATAIFLAQAGAQVTVVERAPAPRTGGQNVDIRGHGLTIIQRLGCEATVRAKTTHEQGLRFVDAQNRSWADFPVGKGDGFTGEIEIMRGDLGNILYDNSKHKVEYVFGDSIKSIVEDANGIEVEFEKDTPPRRVDVVIGADGWASATRKVAFGPQISRDAVKDLGQWAAWYTIPHSSTDANWARWYNSPGKRMILLRPDNAKVSRVSLWIMPSHGLLDSALDQNTQEQKATWHRLFEDAGWEGGRVLEHMEPANDFYMQKIAQVKLPVWSKGRVVLVGDAAYCPSPISGMGTTVALVGSYVLAGELTKSPQDPARAFKAYEQQMRSLVQTAQKLAPGAPSMANPQTAWGIKLLYAFLGVVAWTKSLTSLGASFSPPASATDLPRYEFEA